MGQLESLYDYRNVADVLVGSECLVPGAGLPYTTVLNTFDALPARDAQALGRSMVNNFVDHYTQTGEQVIMSSFNASQIDALTTALANFAGEVKNKAATESPFVQQAINASYQPDASDGCRDLSAFLSSYRALTADTSIRAKIDIASAALTAARLQFGQFQAPASTGTGVWLPDSSYFTTYYTNQYGPLSFNAATGWLDMLKATGVPDGGSGGGYDVEADWAVGDYIVLDWGDVDADIDLATTDPDGKSWAPWEGPDTANMHFSPDSYDDGLATESAQIKPQAVAGDYYIDIIYNDYFGVPPPALPISVKLYDINMNFKQDLGVCTLVNPQVDWSAYCVLHFLAP
jgi:hypothetical protein